MNILLIGQCTLHWGRMEFGNIGNFYIMEPMIRQLHDKFGENVSIKTTFQMSDDFCKKENIEVLPMELFYSWKENDLTIALEELAIAELYKKTGVFYKTTSYIDEVLKADLVIDFSGDIWGDNANFLGENRFLVGLIKDRIPQLLGKKTAMIAGSPGPFANKEILTFAKEVFKNFDLVTNREALSMGLLESIGFNTSKVKSLSCPAFLFEPTLGFEKEELLKRVFKTKGDKPIVGFILCGWNFEKGPFDLWPRENKDYDTFIECIEYIIQKYNLRVCLMSHSNGFPIPPEKFELIHGRDYPIIKQIEKNLIDRGNVDKDNFFSLNGVYSTWDTKAIIGNLDMLISGRVHAAVAGMSQNVPTVVIDYGHEPKAHKLKGFAKEVGMLEYVADPTSLEDMKLKIDKCWQQKEEVSAMLNENIKIVKEKAIQNFKELAKLF